MADDVLNLEFEGFEVIGFLFLGGEGKLMHLDLGFWGAGVCVFAGGVGHVDFVLVAFDGVDLGVLVVDDFFGVFLFLCAGEVFINPLKLWLLFLSFMIIHILFNILIRNSLLRLNNLSQIQWLHFTLRRLIIPRFRILINLLTMLIYLRRKRRLISLIQLFQMLLSFLHRVQQPLLYFFIFLISAP